MLSLKRITVFWGICDICSIGWYVGLRIFQNQIPFYYDILKSIETNKSFSGSSSVPPETIVSLLLYTSLAFSGVYLIKLRKAGAIMAYLQTPFRLFIFIPPSIFFITWPLKYFWGDPGAIWAIGASLFLIVLSEGLKLWSIIRWHRRIATA